MNTIRYIIRSPKGHELHSSADEASARKRLGNCLNGKLLKVIITEEDITDEPQDDCLSHPCRIAA